MSCTTGPLVYQFLRQERRLWILLHREAMDNSDYEYAALYTRPEYKDRVITGATR